MSFDLSRISFDDGNNFLGVIMQQGRVQLDADWNEWVAQFARRIQAGTLDTLSQAAVPRETPDGFRIEVSGGRLIIHPGRIYVDGLLVENHGGSPNAWNRPLAERASTAPVPYRAERPEDAQPYLPNPQPLPVTDGPHLVYLDVWQREVTHLQEPNLVEKAVGVDSTGRVQTVWQVKVLADVGNISCATSNEDIPRWSGAIQPSAGRLSTATGNQRGNSSNPCEIPPAAGYSGLENQLYRVEIHRGGRVGTDNTSATFKWSRDNATVATRVTQINPARNRITVDSVGRDDVLRFNNGDWVEITDDWCELNNQSGEMRRIRLGGEVNDANRTIELEAALPEGVFATDDAEVKKRHTRIRRWDQAGQVLRADGNSFYDLDAATSTGAIPVPPAGTRLFLENGILVESIWTPLAASSRVVTTGCSPPAALMAPSSLWIGRRLWVFIIIMHRLPLSSGPAR